MILNNDLLACVLLLGAAPAAVGCGFHSGLEVQLESIYAGSFPVAVALRKAVACGRRLNIATP